MSLYREPGRGRRTRIVAASVLLLLGLLVGFGIGRATAPEPSLAAQVGQLRERAALTADAVELVGLHYGASNAATQQAVRDQLAQARERFADVERDLAAVAPARAKQAGAALDELTRLVERRAPAAQVEGAARTAERALTLATR